MSSEQKRDDSTYFNGLADLPSAAVMFRVADKRLTRDQAVHVEQLGLSFCKAVAEKYARGQQEHGGNLWDRPLEELVDEAIAECVDQFTYLMTIKRKLTR